MRALADRGFLVCQGPPTGASAALKCGCPGKFPLAGPVYFFGGIVHHAPIVSSLYILAALVFAVAIFMILERRGAPVVLNLDFKGDIKRESRWFAQYGQAACALVVAAVMWRLDVLRRADGRFPALLMLAVVFGTGIVAMLIKRLAGRVRPGRENAGRFLGPTWRHANFRESFPSSHSACAVGMTVILSYLYPQGAPVFWTLALLCAGLRYIMDAHWPSDVLGGIALGYGIAIWSWELAGRLRF